MISEIGVMARDILDLIEEKRRPLSINEIAQELKISESVVKMSLGWLVQKGYVETQWNESEIYVSQIPHLASV